MARRRAHRTMTPAEQQAAGASTRGRSAFDRPREARPYGESAAQPRPRVGQPVPQQDVYDAGRYRRMRQEMENIVLVGMPGSGKSTVAARLAEKLDRIALDSDAEIEEKNGATCAQLIEKHGEAEFRKLESGAIAELGKRSGAVIATGGGCVTRRENYPLLHQNGTIFRLTRDLAKLPTEGRPISQTTDLAQLCARREPLYRRFADVTVSNDGALEATVQTIKEALL